MGTGQIRGVVVTPGEPESARVEELPRPSAGADECLVRVLEVGVDGTDREIAAGEYGNAPEGHDYLVVGHESVGRVIELDGQVLGVEEGDLVVATVRRPCADGCTPCRNGQVDFCTTGNYTERGIKGRHGFFREYYAERPEHLVRVPDHLGHVAVWLEPISVIEKAFRLAEEARSMLPWEPQRLLVTGAGNLGILAALKARLHDWDVQLYSRGPAEGSRARIIEATGIHYADSEEESLQDVAKRFGTAHLAMEATGFSPLAWKVAQVLDPNGVACLLSVTNGDKTTEIASDELNNALVLGNRAMLGAVNADRRDFETGLHTLDAIHERWPTVLDEFVTDRISLDQLPESLHGKAHDDLKTVVELEPIGGG